MPHHNRAGTLIKLGRPDAAAAIQAALRLEPDASQLAELDAQLAKALAEEGGTWRFPAEP